MAVNYQVGDSIGQYRIVREIGIGGGGRVLQVEHMETRRREAMKILVGARPTAEDCAQGLPREIRLQAILDHPNIAAVSNAFWLGEDLVLVMESIQGQTLQKLLERRRPTVEEGLGLIRQVLEALAHAHANGVFHRDVSTGNIVVTESGRIKLTDFGLAGVSGACAADQRGDLYSTGVVLYELLTGTRHFDDLQPPMERNPAIPRFIDTAIRKAMSKNPAERFQSAAEFLRALEGPVEEAPVGCPVEEAIVPSEYTHSYAVPLPNYAEELPAVKPARFGLARKVLTSPVFGTVVGIGVVVAAVAPVLFYDFQSGKPRFGRAQASPVLKVTSEPSDSRPHPEALIPGPREVPVPRQVNGSASSQRRTGAKRAAGPVVSGAPAPPPIVVWGQAQILKPEVRMVEAQPAVARSRADVSVSAPKFDEPPTLSTLRTDVVLPAAGADKPVVDPNLPPPRRTLLRRFANGMRALNPVKRDSPAPAPAAPKTNP